MIDSTDSRLQFDIRHWRPADLDAPYVDAGAWESLNDLAFENPIRLDELVARARRLNPGNGMVDYLLAARLAERDDGTGAVRAIEAGNAAPTLYAPTELPLPLGTQPYLRQFRTPLKAVVFWKAKGAGRSQKVVLATDMMRRLALCAPVTKLKALLFVATWRFLCARDFRSHLLELRIHQAVQDIVSFGKLRQATLAVFPIELKSLNPVALQADFRKALSEVVDLNEAQYRSILEGRPIADKVKMSRLEDAAREEFAEEYAKCLEWIGRIAPGSNEPAR